MNVTTILDECLERIAQGESAAECLERYGDAAKELAPMLEAAEQLRVLSAARLSPAQRLRAKVALREELAVQREERQNGAGVFGLLQRARGRVAPVAALLAAVLFVSVAFSAVASSAPGDVAYPVRVAVEQASASLQWDATTRVAAQLALADRRLAELLTDEAGDPVALEALLRAQQAALAHARTLSPEAQAATADRIAAQTAQLKRLAGLAGNATAAERFGGAAEKAQGWLDAVHGATATPGVTATLPAVETKSPRAMTAVVVTVIVPSSTVPAMPVIPTITVPPYTAPAITVQVSVTVSPALTRTRMNPRTTETVRPQPRLTLTRPAVTRPARTQTVVSPEPRVTHPALRLTPRPRSTVSVQPPVRATPLPPPSIVIPTVTAPTVEVGTVIAPSIPPTPDLSRLPTVVIEPPIPPTPDLSWLPTVVVEPRTPRAPVIPIPTGAPVIVATPTPGGHDLPQPPRPRP